VVRSEFGRTADADAMSDRQALIVVAHSARALAFSARWAGFAPLAIDLFGDVDTRAASAATIVVEGAIGSGFDHNALARAVDSLTLNYRPIGLVYGAGFEHDPDMIASLAERICVFGNDAATVKRSKEPRELAKLCQSLGVKYPDIATTAPVPSDGWLAKQRGGSGGSHIKPAWSEAALESDFYFQRCVAGRPVSALFLADGWKAELVGFSIQWTSPSGDAPFRYGGAVGPAEIEPFVERIIRAAVAGMTAALGLRGLNCVDFLVSHDDVHLLEVNPRPGATLDVFDRKGDPLIARHIAACKGVSSARPPVRAARAAEIVYATREIVIRAERNWPGWIADRSPPGTPIAAGGPLCTVLAEGPDVESARLLAAARAREALAFLAGSEP